MGLKLITPPAAEPITLDEAKAHLRIDGADDDVWLGIFIKSVREYAEAETGRALTTQTWEKTFDTFPDAVRLQYPPLQSVTSIRYVDTDGATQTMDELSYAVDTDNEPGWIVPAYGTDWPETLDTINAVRVRFVCGYASADAVPAPIKAWMLVRLATYSAFREAIAAGTTVDLPRSHVDGLLDAYKVWGWL